MQRHDNENDTNDANSWISISYAKCADGLLEEALAASKRAIDLAPSSANAWSQHGAVLYLLGHHEEALAACERAIDLEPGDSSDYINKGEALKMLGRYEEALEACEQAIAIERDSGGAWLSKGNNLYRLGRPKEALAAYEKAVVLLPVFVFSWNGKGNALTSLRRYDEALFAFERAIDLAPEVAAPWNGRGNAYRGLEQIEEACQSYRRFVHLADGSEVLNVAGNLLRAFGLERLSPLLLLRLVRETPGILSMDGWLQAVRRLTRDYDVPLSCLCTLESDLLTQSRRMCLRVGGCLTFHLGDPEAAEYEFFDVLNDEFPDDLLGQYYLVSARDAYLADNALVVAEAVSTARRAARSDPEHWYYAACILALAGEDEDALKALEGAGAYTPALLLRFRLAWAANEDAAVRALAEQILDLEEAALPQRRLLRFNTDMEFDLTSSEWMEGILHWAKQTELAEELNTFLGYLDSGDCYDLRLKHGEALLETQIGAMDLAVAWRLDGQSRQMMEGLADGARRANLDELRLQLGLLNVDVKVFDGLQGVGLGENIEAYLRNSSLEMEVETILVAYFYASKALPLREAFLLLVYRQYRHRVSVDKGFEDWHIDGLLNFAGGVGSTVSPLLAWQASGSAVSTLLALLVPASLTWVTSRIVRGKSSPVMDYATFKAELSQEAQKKGWELPEGFWDDDA